MNYEIGDKVVVCDAEVAFRGKVIQSCIIIDRVINEQGDATGYEVETVRKRWLTGRGKRLWLPALRVWGKVKQ